MKKAVDEVFAMMYVAMGLIFLAMFSIGIIITMLSGWLHVMGLWDVESIIDQMKNR